MLGTAAWVGGGALVRLGPLTGGALLVAAIGVGCLIAAALVSMLVPAHLDDEVQVMTVHLETVGRGDLSRPRGDPSHSGPLAPALKALAQATDHLRSSLGPARTAARETSVRSDELVTQCAAAHVASQRTAEQGAHVAEHAVRGAESAGRCVDDLRELSTGVRDMEGRYRAMVDEAGTLTERAGRAAGDLAQTGEALDELTARFDKATEHLAALGQSVDEVREFVTLVRKMARQSKLLSLNAAMEAARAGEQGSGFGVVASEVRRLARSSSEAADRTEKLLHELISGVSTAYDAARESLGLARGSKASLERSREELGGLRVSALAMLPGSDSPTAQSAALMAHIEQLGHELTSLATAAKDARLAGSAQVARLQDLNAAAHSLSRSAARSGSAMQHLRLEEGTEPAPQTPIALELARSNA